MEGPARFGHGVFSADRAIALLSRPYPTAEAGTEPGLFALMTLRLAGPAALRELGDPAGLSYVRVVAGELRVGSLARHAELLGSAVAGECLAILRDVGRVVAGRVVRCSATVGGMLCQADPSEDLGAVLAAVKASMVIRGSEGLRTVPAREFYRGPYQTVVEPGELLTEIRIPIRPGGSAYAKALQAASGCPMTGAAAWLGLDGDTVTAAGLGMTPAAELRGGTVAVEEFLAGARLLRVDPERAGQIAARYCGCSPGMAPPARGRRCMAGQLTTRAVRRALLRARGQDAGLC
jgi:carbon-monoxide dehydrogenase medium subunit